MGNILSPIYAFAEGIVSSAQPVMDGGIIEFMMKNVLFVNSSEKAAPTDHVFSTISRGGYLVGLVFGLIWAIMFIVVGAGLFICHCRRKSHSKASILYSMIANRIQYKRGRMKGSWLCQGLQFVLSDVFVLITVVMCILAFVVNAHLNSAMTSTKSEDAVIPRVSRSVNNLHDYVKLLVPHARIATKPIVDEIIYKTALMQNRTREIYSLALAKRMKGDILQKNGVLLVEYFSIVYNSMDIIAASQSKLSTTPLDSDLRNARNSLLVCCQGIAELEKSDKTQRLLNECNSISGFFKPSSADGRIVNVDFKKIQLKEASTLVTLMGKYNQTPAAMRAEMGVSLQKKKAIEDRLYLKSQRVLKVSETIRNMTAEQWNDLEVKIEGASGMFDNITKLIHGDVHQKLTKYERIRNVIYVLVLLLILVTSLICAVAFLHQFCVPGQLTRRIRNMTKMSLYTFLMILSFAVIVCMGTFLLAGYSQTEVCRYLQEEPSQNGNSSSLSLDKTVNNWLDEHWSEIEAKMGNESSMPLPRPRDIFYGLETTCRANKSIMLAINAIDSMDPTATSKPEVTNRFLRLGRELMHESLRTTKPEDLLRPTMKSDMEQLLKLVKELIVKPNYQDYIDELSKPLVLFNTDTAVEKVTAFKQRLQSEAKVLKDKRYVLIGRMYSVVDILTSAVTHMAIYRTEMKNQRVAFVNLKNHMNISDIVNPMFPAIAVLSSYLNNKTKWISEADAMYDEIIVKSTLKNSPKLMAESTVKIMSVLGPCRYLYEAYKNLVFASCTTIVQPLNLMWFFMGCSLFFLTPCILIALLILTKEMSDISAKAMIPGNEHPRPSGDVEAYDMHARKSSGENT